MTADPYQASRASAARLAGLSGHDRHDVAVVLGSGFAPAAAALGPAGAEIPLADLGGFPPPTVAGHTAVELRIVAAAPNCSACAITPRCRSQRRIRPPSWLNCVAVSHPTPTPSPRASVTIAFWFEWPKR